MNADHEGLPGARVMRLLSLLLAELFKVHFSPGGNLKRNIACKGIKRHLQAMAGAQA